MIQKIKTNHIFKGDAKSILKSLPGESVDMVMTSPPYWALRDYHVKGQLGLESNFEEYILKLCDVFDEVKRVLKEHGTCWVNLGDTYSGNSTGKTDIKYSEYMKYQQRKLQKRSNGYPEKSLCMIPLRFAVEMVKRSWILRNVIIWHKPNAMPSSVRDRFTVDFEYLFFFVKSKNYYFNQAREPHKKESIERTKHKWEGHRESGSSYAGMDIRKMCHPDGRNKRCVWSICTKPLKEEHFASYPQELCRIPIEAGCPKNGTVLDPFFGAGTTGLVAIKQNKKFVGIEINPSYISLAKKRIRRETSNDSY